MASARQFDYSLQPNFLSNEYGTHRSGSSNISSSTMEIVNSSHVTVSSADYQPVVLQNSTMRSLRDDLAILSSASSEFQLLLEENPNLLQALTAYEVLMSRPTDVTKDLAELMDATDDALGKDDTIVTAANELRSILQTGHSGAMCTAAKKVASQDYAESFGTSDLSCLEEGPLEGCALRVVRLVKGDEPLGATAKIGDDGSLIVARVIKGGAADRSGLIHVNDRIVEVNGIRAKPSNVEAIMEGLSQYQGQLIFVLEPGEKASSDEEAERMYLRPNFSFDPKNDPLLPCHDAGVEFTPGVVLEVLQTKDEWWWQAKIISHPTHKTPASSRKEHAGLIPSEALIARREKLRMEKVEKAKPKPKKKILGGLFQSGKSGATKEDEKTDEISKGYKSVVQFGPSSRKRPLVVISPRSIDKFQLRRRLIHAKSESYRIPTPSTTRPKQATERDGVDYHFINRADFDSEIANDSFLEYGMNKAGFLYGTLMTEVLKILDTGKTPLLCPPPQSLNKIRNKDFKAFVVFLKPVDRINCKWDAQTMREAGKMESEYAHQIDVWIEYDTTEFAFRRLQEIAFSLENEPQWIEKDWVKEDS